MDYYKHSNLRRKARKRVDNLMQKIVTLPSGKEGESINQHLESHIDEPELNWEGCQQDMREPLDSLIEEIVLNREGCLDMEDSIGCSGSSSVKSDHEILLGSLGDWAVRFGVSLVALSALLSILRIYFPFLPKDGRSLLKTKTDYKVEMLAGGSFHYFGIVNVVQRKFTRLLSSFPEGYEFLLQLNFDGLPLFKSSSIQFWPILGKLPRLSKKPFVIALFCGTAKPKTLSDYLKHVVQELKSISTGFVCQGKSFLLKVCSVICDAPARAFIKGIKSHTGYYGCDKCLQRGIYTNHRITFPELTAACRTDESFRLEANEDHHLTHCPLVDTGVDMVAGFPHDYMHLVCLGVMRRLFELWVGTAGSLRTRISSLQASLISDKLLALAHHIPSEFARKPRALNERLRWKATELRQFLLFTGPIVLKGVLLPQVYDNFMLLSVAIYILVSPQYCLQLNHLAHHFLVSFVEHYGLLYGKDQVVYNIHGLVHLAGDVKVHGHLDGISGFPYENLLGELKRMIRKAHNPLPQVIRRLSEHEQRGCDFDSPIEQEPFLKSPHHDGPVPEGLLENVSQFKQLTADGVILKTSSKDDCIVIDGNVVSVQNIVSHEDKVYAMYQEYRVKEALYSYPLDSRELGIYIVSHLSPVMHCVEMVKPVQKCVRLPLGDKFAVFPLPHTN